jgi:hypothetical protein
MEKTVEHHCLPRTAQTCSLCGELLALPAYCETCGVEISPQHVCPPRPLPHVCPPQPAPGRCLDCGQPLPAKQYCETCGEEITPSHRCPAAPPTHIHRADPLHVCPSMKLQRCPSCRELLPGKQYCTQCGMEITPPHVCHAEPAPHACPPHLLMPRYCSHCGDPLPRSKFCTQCGAEITPAHVCDDRA